MTGRSPYFANLRRPPEKYLVETFDDSTGFWVVCQVIPVVWPEKSVRRWFRRRLVKDVGNYEVIVAARRAARIAVLAQRGRRRIIEVKDNGRYYRIWEEKWL